MNTTSIATATENYISDTLVKRYRERLSQTETFAPLLPALARLENRSKEFHNPSFVVLVVGPVKSGKSTFVNLVANSYVSPTHFLECTVRPSIISMGKKKELTIYRTQKREEKKEQMNDILDCLNGLMERDQVSNISTTTVPLSEENIDKYVRLDLCGVENDDILLTSITTEGGKLLQENVFLVDMAGFDGANVSLDTPTYQAVIERADFIVFVQSSNSAISKVSSTFFDIMHARNTSAPVCLIHNIFESAYWRSPKQKENEAREQKNYAIDAIRDRYKLTLEEGNAFNLNLGKVNDLRVGNYEPASECTLRAEEMAFARAEENMFELFSRRDTIRMRNCIARTAIQQNTLLTIAKQIETDFLAKKEDYDLAATEFNKLKVSPTNLTFAVDSPFDVQQLQTIVITVYKNITHELNGLSETVGRAGQESTVIKLTTEKARELARKFLSEVQKGLEHFLNERIKAHRTLADAESVRQLIAVVNTKAAQHGVHELVTIEMQTEQCSLHFDYAINIEELLPRKSLWWKYTGNEVMEKLLYIKERMNGFDLDGEHVNGYVAEKAYSIIVSLLNEDRKRCIDNLILSLNAEIDRLKTIVLTKIIPNRQKFDTELLLIRNFIADIDKLKIPQNE